ncbi:MAG: O-antigen ligase family protein [Bryobacterales bacterium]|nr:O-antigen ligase family protein [Bryobacterales bacterium]
MRRFSSSGAAAAIAFYAAGVALIPNPLIAVAMVTPLLLAPACLFLLAGANRWLAGFLGAVMLLPPLPVALGNTGPHPALALAAAGTGIGVLRIREWRPRLDSLSASLLLLFLLLLASVAPAAIDSGAAVGAGSLARVLLFGISVYVYFYCVHGPGARIPIRPSTAIRWLTAAAVFAAAFACFDFYCQLPAPAGYGPQFIWLDSGVYRRAQGLFYEASTLGNFCAYFLVMIAVIVTGPREWRFLPRSILPLAGGVLSAALVFSFSRGSIVCLAAALATLLYLHRGRYKVRHWLLVIGTTLAIGIAAVFFFFPSFGELYWARIRGSLEFFLTDPNGILSGRLSNWRALADLLRDNPWYLLTGAGYKTLPYSQLPGRPLVVDNMYLSLLAETGIAGLAAFLAMNYQIVRKAYRIATRSLQPDAAFFGTWICCFWVGELAQMLSGDLFTYWRVLPIYFWTLAMAVRLDSAYERTLR